MYCSTETCSRTWPAILLYRLVLEIVAVLTLNEVNVSISQEVMCCMCRVFVRNYGFRN